MAYDEGLAEMMREDLGVREGLSEKKMFGGLCFLLNGHMVCGVHSGGAMYRVGKASEDEARALPGTGPMMFTGRAMGGMVDADEEAIADDDVRGQLTALSLAHAASLPPK